MSIPFNAKKAVCPGCGAQLIFKTGSARLVICDYCGYAVAETSSGIENIGKVADLVPTGAKLTLGLRGSFQGRPFQIVGREQLRWDQGVWDEWFVSFDDGRWCWLAEDDGEYMLSVRVHNRLTPRRHMLRIGKSVQLGEDGRFTVTEIRTATWVSGRGQLPTAIRPGDSYDYADLSGQNGKYATLDFSRGDVPIIYMGRKVALEELHLETGEGTEGTEGEDAQEGAGLIGLESTGAEAMVCPNCKAPLTLQAPDLAKQVTCAHCGSLLKVSGSRLAFLKKLPHGEPARFLGKKCTFFGTDYLTIGWMRRGGEDSDGLHFEWEEYLLFDEKSTHYRFLCVEDDHWSFSTPIDAGDVQLSGDEVPTATYQGDTYKKFADDVAAVEAIQGEFFWRARVGDSCRCCDYIAPPQGLSSEEDEHEISWSHDVHLDAEEVLTAYGDTEPLDEPVGVGPLQPSPSRPLKWKSLLWALGCAVAAFLMTRTFVGMAPNEQLIHAQLPLKTWTPIDTPPVRGRMPSAAMPQPDSPMAVDVLPAFEVEGNIPYNLELNIWTNVDNGWAALDIALINETTSEVFDLGAHELSYYHGYEGGESWSEGSRSTSSMLGSLPPGRYVMRVDSAWGQGDDEGFTFSVSDPWLRSAQKTMKPSVTIGLKRGIVPFRYLFMFWGFLLLFPIIFFISDSSFETSRWSDSDFGPSGGDDDDDDDDD